MFRKCLEYKAKCLIYYFLVVLTFVDTLVSSRHSTGKFGGSEEDQNLFDNVREFGANCNISTGPEICFPVTSSPSKLPPQYEDCGKLLRESLYKRHPDQDKNTTELLKTYGYPFKEYKVKTKDLYVITLFRILGSPKLQQNSTRHQIPVVLNHGIMGSSEWWFFVPPHKSLPLMLADAGYDVWLNNHRGSSYSLEHEKYNWQTELQYWDYSFHELGLYDVPAIIKLILKNSKHEKIFYIGFSMGTTKLFVCLSEVPEMNEKIHAAFLLSPVALIGHAGNILRYISTFFGNPNAYEATNIAVQGRFELGIQFMKSLQITAGDFCAATAIKCGVCDNMWFAFFGFNAPQINYTEIPHVYARLLNTQSVKTVVHYTHLISTCKFVKFDYKEKENEVRYGSPDPPEYNLTNVNVPLYMFYGEQDNFVVPLDVENLARKFRPGVVKELHKVKDDLFTHADFHLAVDIDKLVHQQIMINMEQYFET